MMPSVSGRRLAASGGALERRKTARARSARTPATTRSVLRVRLCIRLGTRFAGSMYRIANREGSGSEYMVGIRIPAVAMQEVENLSASNDIRIPDRKREKSPAQTPKTHQPVTGEQRNGSKDSHSSLQ